MKEYSKTTSHLRLFKLAYIRDRGWADAINHALAGESFHDLDKAAKAYLTEEEQTEFAEAERVKKAARKRIDAQKTDAYGGPVFSTKRERIRYRWAQSIAWNAETKQHRLVAGHYKDVRQAKSKARSEELERRLKEGTLNFCPYWRGIFMAVLVYLLIVRSTRPVRRFFARMGTGVERRGEQFGEFLLRQLARLYNFASPFFYAHLKVIATIALILFVYKVGISMTLNSIEEGAWKYTQASFQLVNEARWEREAAVRRAQEARELAEANAAAAAREAELRAWNEAQARYARENPNPYVPTRQDFMNGMASAWIQAEEEAEAAAQKVKFYWRMIYFDIFFTIAAFFFLLYRRTGFNVLAAIWMPFGLLFWAIGQFFSLIAGISSILWLVVVVLWAVVMDSSLVRGIGKFFRDTGVFFSDVWHQVHDNVLCPPVKEVD